MRDICGGNMKRKNVFSQSRHSNNMQRETLLFIETPENKLKMKQGTINRSVFKQR